MNDIQYRIKISAPATHYCEIELKFHANGIHRFSLPVWTPGSYLLREFSKFVSNVNCKDSLGNIIQSKKLNKNTWEINSHTGEVIIQYKVYCNEVTVRSCVINDQRAFLNGSNLFMKVEGFESSRHVVEFDFPDMWKSISTGLYHDSGYKYFHNNYDDFIDCPIEIGNQHIEEFEVNGVKHIISIQGKGNFDPAKFKAEFKSIVETQVNFFGDMPYDFYVFLIDLQETGYGGLEHKNSFAAIFPRWEFSVEKTYRKFLGLVSHEYFHLWNVKRIRPVELGPFDYNKENYTISHWVTEGWTSYYDNLFLYRAKLIDEIGYLKMIEREVNEVMHYNGRHEMSLAESSFDNWIKFYRRYENTRNDEISYYTKGALVAMMLNLEIIKSTDCQKSLDNVLLALWEVYKNNPAVGYTQEQVKKLCEDVCGKNLDEFWDNYVYGTSELPIEEFFQLAGCELFNKNEKSISFDVTFKDSSDNIELNEVHKGGTAYESGLQHNDEIIAFEGIRIKKNNFQKVLDGLKVGEVYNFTVNRNGVISNQSVKILPALPEYKIKLRDQSNEEQKRIKNKWLNG